MTQTIIKIGNSQGVTIPKSLLEDLDLKAGSRIDVEVTMDSKMIISKPGTGSQSAAAVSTEFMEKLKGVNQRYGPALKKLAEL